MKVLVSACLMGENCKYNGENKFNPQIANLLADKDVMRICPEISAGLNSPRPRAEIADGIVVDENGNNVDAVYRDGVRAALSKIGGRQIDLVILQSRSPTCGVNQVYDGGFSGRLIAGSGLFATALRQQGYNVIDAEDIDKIIAGGYNVGQ